MSDKAKEWVYFFAVALVTPLILIIMTAVIITDRVLLVFFYLFGANYGTEVYDGIWGFVGRTFIGVGLCLIFATMVILLIQHI